MVPLSNDYKVNDTLNTSSQLVTDVNCLIKASGGTDYADAIEAARSELDTDGRPDAEKVIVFMSDGAARNAAKFDATSTPYWQTPCHQGIASAGYSKAKGTLIYSIGYGIDACGNTHDHCVDANSGTPGTDESPAITPYQALQGIASPGNYLNKPTPGAVTGIFLKIAADISRGTSRLIDNPS
jgi:hypothetical protein